MEKVTAKIIYSQELSDRIKNKIEKFCFDKFGKNLIFEYVLDASILGGVIIICRDFYFDGSIKNQLNKINEKLG